jgi:hypothetical protein
MIRFFAAVLLCVFSIGSADARQRVVACVEGGDVMRPLCGMGLPYAQSANFLQGVKSIRVKMTREARPARRMRVRSAVALPRDEMPFGGMVSIAKPARYIAGRLICAINVNSALAERGIVGTGSALAKSFLSWGRSSPPVPGAIAVSSRGRRGGHVAIVSRVEGGRVYVWNPSPRGRGWQEQAYRHRAIDYRVPS